MKSTGPDSIQSLKVLMASFIIRFLTMGLIETAGILMVASVYSFDVTRQKATLPYTLVYCVRNATGPLIGYIGYLIGSRYATLYGCIIASFAVGCCFLATSILTITILWGILLGIGMAFGTLFLNAIIIEHFEKHLAKATGFSGTGVQLGTIFYSLMLGFFINSYGLSGAFLLSSGLILHCIPAGLLILLNQPENPPKMKDSKPIHVCDSSNIDNERYFQNAFQKNDFHNESIFHITCDATAKPDQNLSQNGMIHPQTSSSNQDSCKEIQGVRHFSAKSSKECEVLKDYCREKQTFNLDTTQECDILPNGTDKPIKELRSYSSKDPYPILKNENSIQKCLNTPLTEICLSLPPKNQPSKLPKQKNILLKLFCDPVFLLILVSGGLYYFSSLTFLTILVDYTNDIGIPMEYAKYALIWYSISELLGGLSMGCITDYGLMTNNGFAALCFFIACLTMVLIIYVKHYILLAVLILVHQLGVAGLTLIYSSIILESVEKILIDPAMASLFILAAPLSLSVLPLIGYFKDQNGSYAGVFYTIAVAELLGCFLHFLIPLLNKRRNSHRNQIKNLKNSHSSSSEKL